MAQHSPSTSTSPSTRQQPGRTAPIIEIAGRFCLVEVPDGAVNEVISAMKNTTLKGKRVNVRREINRD